MTINLTTFLRSRILFVLARHAEIAEGYLVFMLAQQGTDRNPATDPASVDQKSSNRVFTSTLQGEEAGQALTIMNHI